MIGLRCESNPDASRKAKLAATQNRRAFERGSNPLRSVIQSPASRPSQPAAITPNRHAITAPVTTPATTPAITPMTATNNSTNQPDDPAKHGVFTPLCGQRVTKMMSVAMSDVRNFWKHNRVIDVINADFQNRTARFLFSCPILLN